MNLGGTQLDPEQISFALREVGPGGVLSKKRQDLICMVIGSLWYQGREKDRRRGQAGAQ